MLCQLIQTTVRSAGVIIDFKKLSLRLACSSLVSRVRVSSLHIGRFLFFHCDRSNECLNNSLIRWKSINSMYCRSVLHVHVVLRVCICFVCISQKFINNANWIQLSSIFCDFPYAHCAFLFFSPRYTLSSCVSPKWMCALLSCQKIK